MMGIYQGSLGLNNLNENGEADGPYSPPSQPSCREGGAKEAKQSAQPYSIARHNQVNAEKSTAYYLVKIHIMCINCDKTVP
jgi:hypothetical protein